MVIFNETIKGLHRQLNAITRERNELFLKNKNYENELQSELDNRKKKLY